MTNAKLLCAVVVGSLSVAACAKQGSTAEPENAYSASNTAEPAPNTTDPLPAAEQSSASASLLEPGPVGATGPVTTPIAAAPAPAPLTDGQILRVTETVDKDEIEQAKEVQKKAKNPEVKKLAAHLIQQHTKSKQKGQTLIKKTQLTPEDSSVATDLTARSEECMQTIKTAQAPADAERAFVDAQVRQQETLLELLDKRLIPSAINADLKAQLEETRKMIETHMEETKKVQQAIGSPGTGATPPAG